MSMSVKKAVLQHLARFLTRLVQCLDPILELFNSPIFFCQSLGEILFYLFHFQVEHLHFIHFFPLKINDDYLWSHCFAELYGKLDDAIVRDIEFFVVMCEVSHKFSWGFEDVAQIFVILDVRWINDMFKAFKAIEIHNLDPDCVFFCQELDFYVEVIYLLLEVSYFLLELISHH